MKSFLKYLLATIVGTLVTTILLLFILLMIISAASQERPLKVEPNTLLVVKLDKIIVERAQDMPFGSIPIPGGPDLGQIGLDDILANIEKASRDENIDGIYLNLTSLAGGMGTIKEIRDALLAFRDSGKYIIAYSDYYDQRSYYLASAADRVYMNPEGILPWLGLSSQVMYFKEALDKLGVDMQVIRHGSFKAAVEPFLDDQMSDENKEQISAYLGSMWDVMLEEIGQSRNISKDTLDFLAENFTITSTGLAMHYGLFDGLKYKDEILRELKDSTGTDYSKDLSAVKLSKYTRAPENKSYKGLARKKIAVVYAWGDVIMGEGEEGSVGADRISRAIREARRDSGVQAIVLRINSPGGNALAAEVIWREVKLASETKPLVASMGDLAASGGYYIAAPADTILALPNTITGSIGIFGLFPSFKGFFDDKLHINVETVKTNAYADLGSPFRKLTPSERMILQKYIDEGYNTFVDHVAEGRGMSFEDVDKLAGGRVWSGEDAKAKGLVDLHGGINDAVELAAKMAGLERYRVVKMPEIEDPLEKLLRQLSGNARTKAIRSYLGEHYSYYETLKRSVEQSGIMARVPYDIKID